MNVEKPRKILVTGASGALGARVADRFGKAGFQIIGTTLPNTAKGLPAQKNLEWLEVDLGDSRSVRALSEHEFDAVVHCAGGFRYSLLENTSDEDLDFLFSSNLKSSFLILREVLPKMKKRNFGRIVLISSKATFQPGAGISAYAASKAGLNALVSSLAEEVKDFDITVNAVLPSTLDTPANRRDMPKADFSKWVSLDALAEIIFNLTSELGRPIHGALIPVAGRV